MPAWSEYKQIAKERGALAYEVYVVTSRPGADMELVKATLPDHLAYQGKLEAEGALMLAGPMSDALGEQMNAEGMIIYRAASLEDAKALADGDPMHANGARTYEIRKWLINEGNITINAGFSTGLARLT